MFIRLTFFTVFDWTLKSWISMQGRELIGFNLNSHAIAKASIMAYYSR